MKVLQLIILLIALAQGAVSLVAPRQMNAWIIALRPGLRHMLASAPNAYTRVGTLACFAIAIYMLILLASE